MFYRFRQEGNLSQFDHKAALDCLIIYDEGKDEYVLTSLNCPERQFAGESIEDLFETFEDDILENQAEYSQGIQGNRAENYSGKFSFRPGSSLHKRLALEADALGMSLNEYCIRKLSL